MAIHIQKNFGRVCALIMILSLAACATANKKESVTQIDPNAQYVCGDTGQAREPANNCSDLFKDSDAKMKVGDEHVTVINMQGKALESPVVSPDGHTIIAISDIAGKAPVDIIIKDLNNPNDMGTKLKKPLMNLFIKGSFAGSSDRIVAAELEFRPSSLPKTVWNYLKTKEWDPIGYHSVISFYVKGKKVSALDAHDFGLPDKTFLEHPRVSPDQKWLTFYVQPGTEMPDPSTQGIYLYNFKTKKTFYLGNHMDKHPTWSGDGQQIYFHEQGKMGDTEIARVGYYDISFNGDEATVKNRVFFNDPGRALGSTYVYQKHPAYHAGLRMVLFHERIGEGCAENPDACKKAIGAFSVDHPELPAIYFKLSYNGKKVTHVQHVDVSDQPDSPLYFVGRVDDESNDRLLSLDFATLQQAQQRQLKH